MWLEIANNKVMKVRIVVTSSGLLLNKTKIRYSAGRGGGGGKGGWLGGIKFWDHLNEIHSLSWPSNAR